MSAVERAGLSQARLANLDRLFKEKYVDSGRLPGTVTLVWRRGELAHQSVIGSMDIERGKPMREDSIFRIYSMTKLVIAVAILMLIEEGKLDLDDDVANYIPSWKNLGVFDRGTLGAFSTRPPARPMKVIDLATHTSGLTYGWMQRTPVDAAYRELGIGDRNTRGGLDKMIEQLAGLPLEFSPGDAWYYSVATDVLGYLVQKISGESLGSFLQRRIFEPLGMHDTGFFCPPEKIARLTSCYKPGEEGTLVIEDNAGGSRYATPANLESGGGGLVSTAGDYIRFCRMLLGRGALDGVRVLSPKSVALFGVNYLRGVREYMEMDFSGPVFARVRHDGLGFSLCASVTVDLGRTRLPGSLGAFGWSGAPSCWFWIDPAEDLAVVFLTQVMNCPDQFTLRRDLHNTIYGAFTESYA